MVIKGSENQRSKVFTSAEAADSLTALHSDPFAEGVDKCLHFWWHPSCIEECTILHLRLVGTMTLCTVLKMVPPFVTAHPFCTSRDILVFEGICPLIQKYFCTVYDCGKSRY